MSEFSKVISKLEERRLAFENRHTIPIFSEKVKKRWNKILESDNAVLSNLSKGRQSIRTRAHAIATVVLQSVGPDVLILVLWSLNQDTLARLDRGKFVNALRTWWNDVLHPRALSIVASQHFASHVPHSTVVPVSTAQDEPATFGIIPILY
jgi:hypothetical protein